VTSTVADLAVVKSGPTAVGVNDAVTYTIVVSNAGPAAADGATVTDTPPACYEPAADGLHGERRRDLSGVDAPRGCRRLVDVAGVPCGRRRHVHRERCCAGVRDDVDQQRNVTAPAGVTDPDPSNNASSVATAVNLTPPANVADCC
jgi:uncharacterized repeat protein (TIGR01451 family)